MKETKSVLPRGLRLLALGALGLAALTFAVACGDDDDSNGSGGGTTPTTAAGATATSEPSNEIDGYAICPPDSAAKELTGAGASFPFPLYSKQIDEYQKLCGVRINYQSVGSGAGIQQITARTVDFGASDGIMTQAQVDAANAAGGPTMMIPGTIAPVAVVVNIPGFNGQLKLAGDVLADIYLKKVTKWNDERIAATNSGVSLPNADITVIHRSDSSGTTNIFTNYLTKVSEEFKTEVGTANSVTWKGDVGAQGNDGVAGQVRQLPGAIGYVELAYAKQANLSVVQLRNQAGNFITPSLESASLAFEGVEIPADTKVVLTNSSNPQAYPITSFSWFIVYTNAQDNAKAQTMAHFLWWAVHDGQALGTALDYPTLPGDAVERAEAQILAMQCGSAACLTK